MRHVLDVSALVLLRNARKLRQLRHDIEAGRFAVVYFGIKRLRKNPYWRKWLDKYEWKLSIRLETDAEHELFAELMRRFGSVECNPTIAPDDLMAITIACCRNWPLIIQDKAAEKVAGKYSVKVIQAAAWVATIG